MGGNCCKMVKERFSNQILALVDYCAVGIVAVHSWEVILAPSNSLFKLPISRESCYGIVVTLKFLGLGSRIGNLNFCGSRPSKIASLDSKTTILFSSVGNSYSYI